MVRLSGESVSDMINRLLALETDPTRPQAAFSVHSLNAHPDRLAAGNLFGMLLRRSQLLERRPSSLLEQADWLYQCTQASPVLKHTACQGLIRDARQILEALLPLCPGSSDAIVWRLEQLENWEKQYAA